MELRHIRSFLVIAEERSFTRASTRLGIAQPPLSAQMRQLELEVGAPLFRRLPHGVELSSSGAAFLEVVRAMPELLNRSLNAARRIARGESGALILGYTPSSIYTASITDTIASFRTAYPDVQLTLEEANTTRLAEGIVERSIDAAFLRLDEHGHPDLRVTPILQEPMLAVMRFDHKAAYADSVELADLVNDPLLLCPREVGPILFDAVMGAFRHAGFEPMLGQPTPQISSIVNLVAAGLGASIVPASMSRLGGATHVFKPIRTQAPIVPLAFATRTDTTSPVVANFERFFGKTERTTGGHPP